MVSEQSVRVCKLFKTLHVSSSEFLCGGFFLLPIRVLFVRCGIPRSSSLKGLTHCCRSGVFSSDSVSWRLSACGGLMYCCGWGISTLSGRFQALCCRFEFPSGFRVRIRVRGNVSPAAAFRFFRFEHFAVGAFLGDSFFGGPWSSYSLNFSVFVFTYTLFFIILFFFAFCLASLLLFLFLLVFLYILLCCMTTRRCP